MLAPSNRIANVILVLAVTTFAGGMAYAKLQIDSTMKSYQSVKISSAESDRNSQIHMEDLSFLNRHAAVFRHWVNSGKIGQVDEMDWVELLLDVSASVDAKEFNYQLGPVDSVDRLNGREVSHAMVSEGEITLDFDAAHGGTVFKFFTELKQNAPAAFKVQDLKLNRIKADVATGESQHAGRASASDDTHATTLLPRESLSVLQTVPPGFGGIKVNATLTWLQIELTAR